MYIVYLDKWMQESCVRADTSDCGYESGCDYKWSWLQVVAGLQPQVVATAKGCVYKWLRLQQRLQNFF
jgi:hypothetical protein